MNDDQRVAWHKKWRAAELDQIDRTLGRVEEGFALVATFLADSPDAEALHAEALFLARRTQALRAQCAQLND